MSYPSYILGRTGSCDDTTGLFVLEGGLTDYKTTRKTLESIAASRDGYEINSRLPFEDGQRNPNVQFLNKTRLHSKRGADWGQSMTFSGSSGLQIKSLMTNPDSVIYTFATKKIADRRYINEVVGLIPKERVIKTILRAKGVATKRIILFGSCIAPEDGGALWIVSPHGFPWRDTKKHILDEGTDEDLEMCLSSKNFLFFGMTGSVPFISGHRQRQPDEEWPRILRIPSAITDKKYCEALDEYLAVAVACGAENLDPAIDFVTKLYIQAKLSGKVAIKPADLISEDTISLADSDILI